VIAMLYAMKMAVIYGDYDNVFVMYGKRDGSGDAKGIKEFYLGGLEERYWIGGLFKVLFYMAERTRKKSFVCFSIDSCL
jgi:hypothetical protein